MRGDEVAQAGGPGIRPLDGVGGHEPLADLEDDSVQPRGAQLREREALARQVEEGGMHAKKYEPCRPMSGAHGSFCG